jgi:hypothetical protein
MTGRLLILNAKVSDLVHQFLNTLRVVTRDTDRP